MRPTTTIAWTDHTVNFWWGCTKVSPACTNCYAEEIGSRFGSKLFGQPVLWGAGKPRFERLEKARAECLKIQRHAHESGTRPRVFINSMSDWLDDEVPIEWLAYLLETLHRCPNVRFQLLTKRPENFPIRMLDILASKIQNSVAEGWLKGTDVPHNVWVGTTVENQHYADERIPRLLQIPAKVRFLSCEPLLGPVDLLRISAVGFGGNEGHRVDCIRKGYWQTPTHFVNHSDMHDSFGKLHWVIAGGESGGSSRPSHPDWFRSLRDQCASASVPFFFKQWGDYIEAGPNAEHLPITKTYKADTSRGVTMLKAGAAIAGNTLDGVKHEAFPQL